MEATKTTTSLRQLPVTCTGHTRPVVHLNFSDICECGYFLISACKDGNPMLRQGDTGDWIGTFLGHKGAVWSVALNKYAMLAATGSADFTAKLWNAVTGTEVQTMLHNHIVKTVAFDTESEHLLTGGIDASLRVFNIDRPELEPEIYPGHARPIKRALFCRDNRCLMSAGEDRTIRLWDRVSGNEVKCLDFVHNANSLELTPDNKILTIAQGSHVSFWDVDTLQKIKEIRIPTKVSAASLHPNKAAFVCGGNDFKLYKYDYESNKEIESFKAHFGPVHSIKYSPDGELFASGSEDGTVRLWQTTVGKNYGLWKYYEPEESSPPREESAP